MSEEDDLARRFFALWAEYLTALSTDPKMIEPLRQWLTLLAGALQQAKPGDEGIRRGARSASDAAPAAGASAERDAAVVELARRVDELAERVAGLERRRRPARSARRRDRSVRP